MSDLRVLVTGAGGFIGRNMMVALERRSGTDVLGIDVDSAPDGLEKGLAAADAVFHLAGVNRPGRDAEFADVNVELTRRICEALRRMKRTPIFVLSSSTQAALDNPYGISKRKAEEIVQAFGKETGAPVFAYRLPGVFGKWSRPDYNSVVATFCHRTARGLPVSVSDPAREIELAYIDDVVGAFLGHLDGRAPRSPGAPLLMEPIYRISLGALAETLAGFRDGRRNGALPDMSRPLLQALYATYLSYLPAGELAYALEQKVDPRGELAEILKSAPLGQVFLSRTRPGITRGHHYHDSKVEKFIVVEGEAVIRLRPIRGEDAVEYRVTGREFRVVDIPPGYTHAIENVGAGDLVVLFWANQMFDPEHPDTYALKI